MYKFNQLVHHSSSLTKTIAELICSYIEQAEMKVQRIRHTTVAILDRYLQHDVKKISRSKLQLVGVASMLIAAKYEEIYAPEVKDFVYITDRAYSERDVLKMEIRILAVLNFNLGRPLPLHFLRRASKAGGVEAVTHTLAK